MTKLARQVAGGLSSVDPSHILSTIDPRDVNVGIDNPYYAAGESDQETYNRHALPWEGAAYAVTGTGEIIKVAGREGAASGNEIMNSHGNLSEVWTRFAAAQQARDPDPGSISALIEDQRSLALQANLDVGESDPGRGEGESLQAKKVQRRQAENAPLQ